MGGALLGTIGVAPFGHLGCSSFQWVTFLWTHGFTAKAQGAGALLLQLAYLFTLHAVWRARTNQRYHDRYPPPTYVVGSTTLKLLSSTIRVAYRKDATKFRQAALPAALAQVVIGDDFSTVL